MTVDHNNLPQAVELLLKRIDHLEKLITDSPAKERPLPRNELMQILQIRDVRTFNKRVEQLRLTSVGKIGRFPAYYLKDFLTLK